MHTDDTQLYKSCLLTGEPYEEVCTEDKLQKIADKLKKLGAKMR